MFNIRAHVGLPSIRCDLARSKPVKNLFVLANVAWAALHPHWGDGYKEAELLNKDSKYLSVHGLATAIHAHSKFCFDYTSALKAKEYVELVHPPCFRRIQGRVKLEVRESKLGGRIWLASSGGSYRKGRFL
ncbi:unnamed protein product [Nippostrongylus brasiliensis]|uniref:Wax2_C domain-containing protein n=1 Tax=Nippostrongylus brasiliensis TaxID=27835 RepID=A0A0N4YED7_NIPBR|nr:unnamed protein product [Nippostrongylus brasiliensis]